MGPRGAQASRLDWVYPEGNRKAAGFVSMAPPWAHAASADSAKTLIELQLAPIR